MVFGIKKEWADEALAIFIAILMFNTIPKLPVVGPYFEQYPYIILGIAVLMLVYRKKIIGMLSK